MQEDLDIHMGSFDLAQSNVQSDNLLGVTIRADLKWTSHIDGLKLKLQARLKGLQTVRNIVDSLQVRKQVAEGIFASVLVYCIPVWGACEKKDLSDLQVLQNVAAQYVLRFPPRYGRNRMFDILGWMTVAQLVFYHTMMAVYRIRKSGEPELLAEKFSKENFRGNIITPNTRLTIERNSFTFRGAMEWCSLPDSLRSLDNIDAFKKGLKKHTMMKVPRFVNSA